MRKILSLATLSALTIFSCGGGGGGGDSNPNTNNTNICSSPLKTETATKAISLVALSSEILEDTTEIAGELLNSLEDFNLSRGFRGLGNPSFRGMLPLLPKFPIYPPSRSTGYTYTYTCEKGGTIEYNIAQEGDTNLTITGTMNNCEDIDGKYNGNFYLYLEVNEQSDIEYQFDLKNFSFSNNSDWIKGDLSIKSEINFTDNEPTSFEAVLNGDLKFYYEGESEHIQYDNLTYYFYLDDNNDEYLKVNGSIAADCLDGWVSLETIEPLLIDEESDDICPIAYSGKLKIIKGKNESIVVFNEDGSIDIDGKTFSCQDVVNKCE